MQPKTPRSEQPRASLLTRCAQWWQPHGHATPLRTSLLGGLGSALALLGVALISRAIVGPQDSPAIAAYMGAAAVLLFAAPTSPMSQPWPVLGGHLLSAFIGVSCYRLIGDATIATAIAVALAIVAMHGLGCLHPPGGAAAMVAVIGGPAIHELGYTYVLAPVGLNAVIMLGLAWLINNMIPGRRYPTRREAHCSSSS